MRNFERKITIRKIIESKPFLVFLGLLVMVFSWSVLRFWNKMQETGRNKEVVEERAAALREKKQKLTEDIERLNTDEGKEEFFRENYGLAKEGEEVIVVVEDKKALLPTPRETSGLRIFFRNLFK